MCINMCLCVCLYLFVFVAVQAIDVFKLPVVKGLILSPCCFPNAKSPITVVKESLPGEDKYEVWTKYLREKMEGVDDVKQTMSYKEEHIYSVKNNVIWSCKKAMV
eukprot:m.112815 g.112815  ORF g.112815 m.112815 type:complete len:105 (+) comp12790_c2_seq1:157-471(+)